MRMARRKIVFRGKTKSLYEGDTLGTYVLHFRDDTVPAHSQGPSVIEGKGVLNNRFSEFVMSGLKRVGIPTHFVRRLNMREQSVRAAEILPVTVMVRNHAAGTLAKRFNLKEGDPLPRPLVEFYLKHQDLNHPLVTEEHLNAFGWVSPMEIDEILPIALRTNDYVSGMMAGAGIKLVDFVLEIGRVWEEDTCRLVIVDEISPDVCRLWDMQTGRVLSSYDTIPDSAGIPDGFQEIASRLGILPEGGLRLLKPVR